MHIAQHHVNNLANNPTLVSYEIRNEGRLQQKTLDSLQQKIFETAEEMQRLEEITEPFDKEAFVLKTDKNWLRCRTIPGAFVCSGKELAYPPVIL